MLECIVYTSTACTPFDATALEHLLHSAREFDAAHGVTGLLIYCDGRFMQMFEGDPTITPEVFKRICRDQRHTNLRLLYRGQETERLFPGWVMALRDARDMSDAARTHLCSVFDDPTGRDRRPARDLASPAMRLLDGFAEEMRRKARIDAALACLDGTPATTR